MHQHLGRRFILTSRELPWTKTDTNTNTVVLGLTVSKGAKQNREGNRMVNTSQQENAPLQKFLGSPVIVYQCDFAAISAAECHAVETATTMNLASRARRIVNKPVLTEVASHLILGLRYTLYCVIFALKRPLEPQENSCCDSSMKFYTYWFYDIVYFKNTDLTTFFITP